MHSIAISTFQIEPKPMQDLAEYKCEALSKEKEDPELQICTERYQIPRLRVEGIN